MSVYEKIKNGLIEAIEYERSNVQLGYSESDTGEIRAKYAFPVIDLAATGANILRLRKEAGLTVKELQAYFGFSDPRAIYAWQQGNSLPSIDNLLALSRILNVAIEDILVTKDPSSEPPDKPEGGRGKSNKLLFFLMAA